MRANTALLGMPLAGLLVLAGCTQPDPSQKYGLTGAEYLHIAAAVTEAGDHEKALSLYTTAAEKFPADTGMQISCAYGMARNGERKEAIALLRSRLRAASDNPDLLRAIGGIQVMQGDAKAAVATLDRMLGKHPDDVSALVDRGVALDMLHRHDEAQAAYRKARAIAPDDVTISNDLALSLMLSGHASQARAEMEPLRDASDLPERVGVNLALIDVVSGHPDDAREVLSPRIGDADLALLRQAISGQQPGSLESAPPAMPAKRSEKISLAVPASPKASKVGLTSVLRAGQTDKVSAPAAERFANVPPPPPLTVAAAPVAAYANGALPITIPPEAVGDASALVSRPR